MGRSRGIVIEIAIGPSVPVLSGGGFVIRITQHGIPGAETAFLNPALLFNAKAKIIVQDQQL
jgi:hypothetical protein